MRWQGPRPPKVPGEPPSSPDTPKSGASRRTAHFLVCGTRIVTWYSPPKLQRSRTWPSAALHFSIFIVILIIGAVVGLAFNRYAGSWLARLGSTTRSDITAALVGIAGAFIGFHISVILGLLPSPLMHYILAAIGALIVLWLWRGR